MQKLRNIVVAMKQLFNKVDERYWGQQMHKIVFEAENERDMAKLVMDLPWDSSFSALKISVANGHNVSGRMEEEVNEQFKVLRDEMFFTARFILSKKA